MLRHKLKDILTSAKFIGFITIFFLIWLYGWHISVKEFYYDSSMYWELGRQFTSSGKFSWLTYDQPIRGYILPFLSFICMVVARLIGVGEMVFYRFAAALFYSCLLAVLIPSLYEKITNQKLKLVHIFSFSALVGYFWRGYFLYPLSDFVSLFFILFAVYSLISYFSKRNYLHILSSGFFIALSTSARPSYQIVLLPILFLFIFHSYIKKDYKKYIPYSLVIMILGLCIGYGPQLFINEKKYDVVSPFIQTGIVYKGSLFNQQLLWGMYVQKYETNINLTTYPIAKVFFYDQQGINLLDKEGIINFKESGLQLPENFTLIQYLKLIIKNPLDMITIYIKHTFNGIDLMYHSGYLDDVYHNRSLFSLLNYTLWFISLLTVIRDLKTKQLIKEKYFELSLIIIILLPALLSIPSAVESRFFLPIFLLNYSICAYYLLNKKLTFNGIKRTIIKSAIPYILFLLICFTLSAGTFASLSEGHYLFHN